MKKTILYSVALLLAAIGCLSFYPKPTANSEYMMLMLRTGRGATLVSISPEGEQIGVPLDKKIKGRYQHEAQLVVKLNELHKQGWTVVHMQATESVVPDTQNPLLGPDKFHSQVYLLKKQ